MTSTKESKIFSPKKLIEVALPLDDINEAAAREKSIRHGHPSTLHLWWARRPLAAARAVIFAQMVNDPGYQQDAGFKYGVNKKEAEIKREKLFQIIRDLVKWENTNNEEVLTRAREAIKESWRETCHLNRNHPQAAELFNPEKLPAFHDPFAGGGAIPLEAQRLGLESYASDLNPVAVMINKAMIEIPPKFAGQAPIGPLPAGEKQKKMLEDWSGTKGLAEDVRRYGHWMREEAFRRLGHLYPKVTITDDLVCKRPDLLPYTGEELTVIAWLWARTVKSPSPAFANVEVPIVSTFVLSRKPGKQSYIKPVIDGDNYSFEVIRGTPTEESISGTSSGKRTGFNCLLSGVPIDYKYIRNEGMQGRINKRMMAVVLEGRGERIYIAPTVDMERTAYSQLPDWKPETPLHGKSRVNVSIYGMNVFGDLFTDRQLITLTTLSDLVAEAKQKILKDAREKLRIDDGVSLADGGQGATAYSEAISIYLSFAVDRGADFWSTQCVWANQPKNELVMHLFGRQAIPMSWDFGEVNVFSNSGGNFSKCVEYIYSGFYTYRQILLVRLSRPMQQGRVLVVRRLYRHPPYYDNIGYADLSDYFYVWMRRSLKSVYPHLFSTMAVPKAEELVATPYRHDTKEEAETFFMNGMTEAIHKLSEQAHPAFPVSIYYAFKQAETKEGSTSSSGWETFLEAVIRAGFSIDGTWPMRTEFAGRMIGNGANALASSVVLVCRKRPIQSNSISRREFQKELRENMPEALDAMIGGEAGTTPIAPVDLAQAAIGPGMAIYSKYEAVLNQDGTRMSVHDALILINKAITDYLNPDSGNFDADTLFCDDWFSQFGWGEGQFGVADTLARAKGTSVDGLRDAGVVESGGGKVRLLKWSEYPQDWDPATDERTPIWEACHQLIRMLNQQGEQDAGALLARMPERGEQIRQLAYHLYTICERKKWAEEARAYNELIGSWHAIVAASLEKGHKGTQTELGFDF